MKLLFTGNRCPCLKYNTDPSIIMSHIPQLDLPHSLTDGFSVVDVVRIVLQSCVGTIFSAYARHAGLSHEKK